MPRIPDRIHWQRAAASLLSLLLAACATTPMRPLDPAGQREALLRLDRFAFSGRVTVKPQGSGPANVDWQQQQDSARVKLSGPFGGGMQLDYSPGSLSIVTGQNDRLVNGEAEEILIQQLGFVPPFASLRYWVRGLPAPGSPAGQSFDADGKVQQLEQQDWLIKYERHLEVQTAEGRVQLPGKLTATRNDLRLILVIDRWRMK